VKGSAAAVQNGRRMDAIRNAVPDDVPAIARVHVDAWRTSYTKMLPSTVLDNLSYEERERSWREIVGAHDIRRVIVAEHPDAGIVGFAACGPNRSGDPRYPGELYAIYLLASHRGVGLGRALFEAVATYLGEQDLTPFVIWVIAGDVPTDRFYLRHGGTRVASQPTVVDGADAYEHAYGFLLPD
jgi:GNAT superfamily N-acetyltransferase